MTSRTGFYKAFPLIGLGVVVMSAGLAGHGPLSAAVDGITRVGAPKASIAEAYGKLPVSFAPNHGQADEGVDFLARGAGYGLALHSTGAVVALTKGAPAGAATAGSSAPASSPLAPFGPVGSQPSGLVRIDVLGADPAAPAEGQDPLAGRVNHLTGNDPSGWYRNLPTFGRVTYREVYPGIDLSYYGNQNSLEYDFIVAPGSDPGRIAIGFQGADSVRLAPGGDLVVTVPGGELRQHAPRIYQEVDATRIPVAGRFVLHDDHRVGFEVDAFDRSRALVIDPVLEYSTYLGGSGSDGGLGITVGADGSAYVTGATSPAEFPTTPGAVDQTYNGGQDGFVTKLAPDGSLVYSTLLGGGGIDDADTPAVHASGALYVRGFTTSPNFPTTPGAFDTTLGGFFDGWLAKLSPDGSSLDFSTYVGGGGFDSGSGLAVDAQGSPYMVGITGSPDFPTTPGAFDTTFHGVGGPAPPPFGPGDFDAYVAKFTPDGSALVYSTFLGGGALDAAFEVAVDPTGRAAVSGVTLSDDFPTSRLAYDTTFNGGLADAFVTRLTPDGSSLVYSTYLGGGGDEGSLALDVQPNGSVHVAGATTSPDFPTTPWAYDTGYNGNTDVYVSRLSADGSILRFSTFLGGARHDSATALALDASGASYVTGSTNSVDFPTTADAFDPTFNHGGADAFVAKVDLTGRSLVYSTYLGGSGYDIGNDIDVGPDGAGYVTGVTRRRDFPTTPGAFDRTFNGSNDAFVTKLAIGS